MTSSETGKWVRVPATTAAWLTWIIWLFCQDETLDIKRQESINHTLSYFLVFEMIPPICQICCFPSTAMKLVCPFLVAVTLPFLQLFPYLYWYVLSERVWCKGDKVIFTKFTETHYVYHFSHCGGTCWAVYSTQWPKWSLSSWPRTISVQHKYPMAEPKLCLNLLGLFLIGLPPGGFISYAGLGFLSGDRKYIMPRDKSQIFKIGLCNSFW